MQAFKQWAKTPPLGWNSWDCFGAAVTEQQLLANADYMAEHLKDYGWTYVVCDIQWYEPKAEGHIYKKFTELCMDGYGRLLPAPNRFPSAADGKGFRPIADYIHAKGLKFGVHLMRGVPRQAVSQNCPILGSDKTCRDIAHPFSVCPWNTDMYGLLDCEDAQKYYDSVFAQFAQWGVDFVKCDDICVTEFRKWDNPYTADYEIEMLRRAIDRCGREIVLSLSPGPAPREKAAHLAANANLWRMTGDFWDEWSALHRMFGKCREWQGVRTPGGYPDCDMLPVAMLIDSDPSRPPVHRWTRFTEDEIVTMFSLWGIFASPLMLGGDLVTCDDFTLSMLTNADYMHMHRTVQNAREWLRDEKNDRGTIIWTAEGDGCKYAALFNTDTRARRLRLPLSEILMPGEAYAVYDIWQRQPLGLHKNSVSVTVPSHGAALLRITKE